MSPSEKRIYLISFAIAIFIASAAAVYKYGYASRAVLPEELPPIGKVGSDHAHASILVMVDDRIIDFCSPEYMLRSQYVHFEDNDCTTVHRHATGVTIPTFFKTIGVGLTGECLTIPGDKTYCDNGRSRLAAVINGEEMALQRLPHYVFRNNDHILLNFGPESGDMLRFKYNQVPQIPLDVNEPINNDQFGKVLEEKPLENVK